MSAAETGRKFKFHILAASAIAFVLLLHLGVVSGIITEGRPLIWPLHNDSVHRLGPGADFFAVYHASLNRTRGLSPYDTEPDGVTPFFYPFRYLPVIADAGRIFLSASPNTARILWILFTEVILAIAIIVLWRRIPTRRLRYFTAGALLLSSPYFLELYMGQFTFVAMALCLIGLLARRGAAAYAGAVLLKVFPLAAVPALLRQPRFRLHLILACSLLLAFSLPYFLVHQKDWTVFYTHNFRPEGGMDSGNYGSVHLLRLFAEDLGLNTIVAGWSRFTSVARLLVLGVTALAVFACREKRTVPGFVVLLLAHFVSYPHVWEHHTSAILLLALLLLTVTHEGRWQIPVIVGSVLLIGIPTPFVLFDFAKDPRVWDPAISWPRHASYLVLLPKVIPTLALFTLCWVTMWRAGFHSPRRYGQLFRG